MMNIQVNISLQQGEETPDKIPTDIIEFFGGDPAKDSCSMSISSGYLPPPPEPEPAGLPA